MVRVIVGAALALFFLSISCNAHCDTLLATPKTYGAVQHGVDASGNNLIAPDEWKQSVLGTVGGIEFYVTMWDEDASQLLGKLSGSRIVADGAAYPYGATRPLIVPEPPRHIMEIAGLLTVFVLATIARARNRT